MHKRLFIGVLTVLVGIIGFQPMAAFADAYRLDAAHSNIQFGAKHLVVARVTGKFDSFTGKVVWDPANLGQSSMTVNIQATSVNTGNRKRDSHLRSSDFLYAKMFPAILFKSKQITRKGRGYVVEGDLTIRGVTKSVRIPFEVIGTDVGMNGKTRIGFQGQTEINRMDYGVAWNKRTKTGKMVVGEAIRLMLEVTAVQI